MTWKWYWLVVAVGAVIAGLRTLAPVHTLSPWGSYQVVAHLYVGGLVGAYLGNRQRTWPLWLALALAGVEVVCFTLGRFGWLP